MLAAARSVRYKLLLVVVATTLTALVVAGVALVYYDVRAYQRSWVEDLMTQADILGRASAPALTFRDPKAASENLSVLQARPQITAAAIYAPNGAIFAKYPAEDATTTLPALPESEGFRIEGGQLAVFKRITDNREILGTVYLRAHYELVERVKSYVAILLAIGLVSLAVAVLMSSWLHSVVIKPILAVSGIARKVSETRDFSLRATKTTTDEVGDLVDGFNEMLAEIERRAQVLEASNQVLAREIEERRDAEEAFRVSEQRNRTLAAAISAVVWNSDKVGQFVEAQQPWAWYTGQHVDEYSGLGWQEAFHPEDRSALALAWTRATAAGTAFELELRLRHARTDSHRYVSMRGVPVVLNGEVKEWIGTIRDIEDQRRAEQELQWLNAELEQRVAQRTAELQAANKELEGFSYSVSHDLRAPVRAISGFARMLWQDNAPQLDDEGRRKLGIIESEAKRMGALIDDLLAFSRLGRKALERVEVDMTALARAMFDRVRAQFDGASPELRLATLPPVLCDRALLEQVWANLLSNAIKYSSKRERAIVEIGAISDEKEFIYYVRDNGAGFDPRYKAKLFGVFQRLHSESEFSGTGVGLALVQRIVVRHGGRVWADGKPDEGATFHFTLPKETGHAGA